MSVANSVGVFILHGHHDVYICEASFCKNMPIGCNEKILACSPAEYSLSIVESLADFVQIHHPVDLATSTKRG